MVRWYDVITQNKSNELNRKVKNKLYSVKTEQKIRKHIYKPAICFDVLTNTRPIHTHLTLFMPQTNITN